MSLPSSSETPVQSAGPSTPLPSTPPPSYVTTIGEQLLDTGYQVHELPNINDDNDIGDNVPDTGTDPVVYTALLARIEYLEAENAKLKSVCSQDSKKYFRIEDIKDDDKLVCFYTGFTSFKIFQAFFEFLGPAVEHLKYWGEKDSTRERNRLRKIDPTNQLFLTLIKLRLNLKMKDLSFRFGLSTSRVSRYIKTWICFLYQHLKEIEWMPKVQQVRATLPTAFKEKFLLPLLLLMGVKSSLRFHQICICSHQRGPVTNTITLLNF